MVVGPEKRPAPPGGLQEPATGVEFEQCHRAESHDVGMGTVVSRENSSAPRGSEIDDWRGIHAYAPCVIRTSYSNKTVARHTVRLVRLT